MFDVVRSANSSSYNYANPVRRDTVSTGSSGDNVTFRFSTDNPGPWLLHWCEVLFFLRRILLMHLPLSHIDWHLKM